MLCHTLSAGMEQNDTQDILHATPCNPDNMTSLSCGIKRRFLSCTKAALSDCANCDVWDEGLGQHRGSND